MNCKRNDEKSENGCGHLGNYTVTYIKSFCVITAYCTSYAWWNQSSRYCTFASGFGLEVAFGTQGRGFAPGPSRRIFRGNNSSARFPSEGK
jgi:hypothetical protein